MDVRTYYEGEITQEDKEKFEKWLKVNHSRFPVSILAITKSPELAQWYVNILIVNGFLKLTHNRYYTTLKYDEYVKQLEELKNEK